MRVMAFTQISLLRPSWPISCCGNCCPAKQKTAASIRFPNGHSDIKGVRFDLASLYLDSLYT